jgi:hypothetical protein
MAYGLPDSWATWAIKKTARGVSRSSRGSRVPFSVQASTVKYSYKFSDLILYQPEFETFINAPTGKVGRYVRARGRIIVTASKAQVGVKTGALRASINMVHSRHKYGHKLWIGSKLSYAYLHHEGSRPHVIVPKKAEFLRFSSGSRVVYSRAVLHPGTRPNRYLSDQLPLAIV